MVGCIRALLVFVPLLVLCQQQAPKTQLVQCRMIWGRAPHNGYTDLIRHNGRWYCVFREGSLAYSPDGALRVITSADGEIWQQAAVLGAPSADVREPKLSTAPDGKLLLHAVAASDTGRRSVLWSSGDGREWSAATVIGEPDAILGRIAWYMGRAYSMSYRAGGPAPLQLYSSSDGLKFAVHAPAVQVTGEPTEASLLFLPQGSAYSLLRREGAAPTAQLGESRSPFRAWTWKELDKTIAGPNLIRLPDGRLLAAARLIDDTVRTSLLWLDPERGTMREFYALPSSGDTGYPGLAFHEGLLWVSYYSSHEGKAMIYLAKVKLPPAEVKKAPGRLTFGN